MILRMRQARAEEDGFSSNYGGSGGTPNPIAFTPGAPRHEITASRLALSPSTVGSVTTEGPYDGPPPKRISRFTLPMKRRTGDPLRQEAGRKPLGGTSEKTNLKRILRLAQRFGMPPPLRQDLELVWDDPVVTLNYGVTTEMEREAGDRRASTNEVLVELGHLPPQSCNRPGQVKHGPSSSWPEAYLDAYSGTDAERSAARPFPFTLGSFFRRGSDNSTSSPVKDIEVSAEDTELEDETPATYITPGRWARLDSPPQPPVRSATLQREHNDS